MSMARFRSDVRRVVEGWDTERAPGRPITPAMRQLAKLPEKPSLQQMTSLVRSRWDVGTAPDELVFVFAAGWRSGSTMLQRVIMGSGEVFLWGEPHARMDLVRRLGDSLRPVSQDWPRDADIFDPALEAAETSARWIANLAPAPGALFDAHRAFFRTFLAPPESFGSVRHSGMKEVRLSADYAFYLKLLFPQAKFVFLVRNPYDQWRSYRKWASWYDRWPAGQVTSPTHFGRSWRHLASSFLNPPSDLGAITVRYEDLVSEGAEAVADHLGIALASDALSQRVTGTSRQSEEIPSRELRQLRRAAETTAMAFGYAPD